MTRIAAALGVAFSLLAHGALATDRPIVITDDKGGPIFADKKWYERIKAAGIPVKIDGPCISSCTLVLSLPKSQVCVTPNARLGFHMMMDAKPPSEPPDPSATCIGVQLCRNPALTTRVAQQSYPPKVREWLAKRSLGWEPQFMSAAEIVASGIFPPCPSSAEVARDSPQPAPETTGSIR